MSMLPTRQPIFGGSMGCRVAGPSRGSFSRGQKGNWECLMFGTTRDGYFIIHMLLTISKYWILRLEKDPR